MAYDNTTQVTDDLDDNLAEYHNELKTAVDHAMSASAYAAYTRTQSMTGNVTLADSDYPIQSFSPTAARDLTLPAVASTNHVFYVFNRSGDYSITVKNASAVVIAVLQPYSHVTLESDGSNLWVAAAGSMRETQYKLTPSISSNDLVLTLTHMDGSTPSVSRPLSFQIGTTWRSVTAALSRTLADGTNWFNSGSAELGTKEIDYFPYVVWDSNSSAVGLTYGRIPNARLLSDFSSTTTNEKYCAGYSDFTSTDEVANIGRFAATLSLSGTSHLWTVPTYTNVNLWHTPAYETRMLSWSPTWTNLSVGNGTLTAKYKITLTHVEHEIDLIFGNTTSISGAVSFRPPFTNSNAGAAHPLGQSTFVDTGTGSFSGTYEANASGTLMRIRALSAGGSYLSPAALSSTVPFTWTTSDEISISGRHLY